MASVVVAWVVDGPVDGALGDSLFRRSVPMFAVGGFASGAEIFGYGVLFGDDRAGLVCGHGCAVDVA